MTISRDVKETVTQPTTTTKSQKPGKGIDDGMYSEFRKGISVPLFWVESLTLIP